MKRIFSVILFALLTVAQMSAQEAQADIKFDKTVHNFGKFTENSPVQTSIFSFTNTGTAPLIINNAVASCGCTVPSYSKAPIKPGEKGTVKVTYNGKGKFPGHFKKTITLRTNAKMDMYRLYVEGDMEEAK